MNSSRLFLISLSTLIYNFSLIHLIYKPIFPFINLTPIDETEAFNFILQPKVNYE